VQNLRHTFLFSLLLAVCLPVFSQHYQFSQFYVAPTYLNPAFTGANACGRVAMNYRKQWTGLPGAFTTYQVAADHYAQQFKSGFGMQFFSDKAGVNNLNTTAFNALYAYETKVTKFIMARGGLSAGFVQRRVDFSSFTFADQISRGEGATTVESFDKEGVNYFDVGAGALVYSEDVWGGFSVAHLNKPNQSLQFAESNLPMEFKFHGGYRFDFKGAGTRNKFIPKNNFLTATFNFKHQNKFNQLDLGLYYSKNILNLGIWYRGIPVFKPLPNYSSNDAIIFLMGFNVEKLKIGYSYDLTISNITNVVSKGTHEISLSYQFCNLKKPRNKKRVLISCPKF
jgi:type IX secretion system PorP/SprF family membrane protein